MAKIGNCFNVIDTFHVHSLPHVYVTSRMSVIRYFAILMWFDQKRIQRPGRKLDYQDIELFLEEADGFSVLYGIPTILSRPSKIPIHCATVAKRSDREAKLSHLVPVLQKKPDWRIRCSY